MKNFLKYTERLLFYGMLAVSVFCIITVHYNPSLDGPAHMYNARLMSYLFAGNPLVNTFHSLNKVPIPNLTDHVILALFNTFLSSAASVKLMLIIYIIAFSLGLRVIIGLLRPENIALSAFAIPFAHSFLLYIGFYNFCISAAFMLWAIYYYMKYFNTITAPYKALQFGIMLLLILAVYFSNGLAFLVLGTVILLLELQALFPYLKTNPYKQNKSVVNRHYMQLLLLWLPGITCFILFILSSHVTGSGAEVTHAGFVDKLNDIVNIRPLAVYSHQETIYTSILFYVIMLLFGTSVITQVRQRAKGKPPLAFTIPATTTLMLLLYFIVPDNASVGMMTVRLCYYFFLFLVLWLVLRKNFATAVWIALPVIYFVYAFLLFNMHAPVISSLDKTATEIVGAEDYIAPNSIVLPVNCSSNWLMVHFTDYDGLKKPVINTDNYESNVGWFPVTWKKDMPAFTLRGQTKIPNALMPPLVKQNGYKEIDYIFVFGDMSWVTQRPYFAQLKSDIENYCKPVFISKDGFIHLYSVNH